MKPTKQKWDKWSRKVTALTSALIKMLIWTYFTSFRQTTSPPTVKRYNQLMRDGCSAPKTPEIKPPTCATSCVTSSALCNYSILTTFATGINYLHRDRVFLNQDDRSLPYYTAEKRMFANTGRSQGCVFSWPFMRRVPGMTGVLPKSKIRTLFCVFHNVLWKYLQWGWRDIWGKLCDFNPLNHKTSRSDRDVLFYLFKITKGTKFFRARN